MRSTSERGRQAAGRAPRALAAEMGWRREAEGQAAPCTWGPGAVWEGRARSRTQGVGRQAAAPGHVGSQVWRPQDRPDEESCARDPWAVGKTTPPPTSGQDERGDGWQRLQPVPAASRVSRNVPKPGPVSAARACQAAPARLGSDGLPWRAVRRQEEPGPGLEVRRGLPGSRGAPWSAPRAVPEVGPRAAQAWLWAGWPGSLLGGSDTWPRPLQHCGQGLRDGIAQRSRRAGQRREHSKCRAGAGHSHARVQQTGQPGVGGALTSDPRPGGARARRLTREHITGGRSPSNREGMGPPAGCQTWFWTPLWGRSGRSPTQPLCTRGGLGERGLRAQSSSCSHGSGLCGSRM